MSEGALALLFGATFGLPGLVMLWLASRAFARDRAIARWPRAPGKITSSRVESRSGRSRDKHGHEVEYTSYELLVQYSYTVEGVELQGDRVARESCSSTTKPDLDRHAPGREVLVYYDPQDPRTAYLEVHRSVGAIILGGMGLVFLTIGVLVPALVLSAGAR